MNDFDSILPPAVLQDTSLLSVLGQHDHRIVADPSRQVLEGAEWHWTGLYHRLSRTCPSVEHNHVAEVPVLAVLSAKDRYFVLIQDSGGGSVTTRHCLFGDQDLLELRLCRYYRRTCPAKLLNGVQNPMSTGPAKDIQVFVEDAARVSPPFRDHVWHAFPSLLFEAESRRRSDGSLVMEEVASGDEDEVISALAHGERLFGLPQRLLLDAFKAGRAAS